jgi:hypothetical protein
MNLLAGLVTGVLLAGAAGDAPALVVHATDSPVKIDRATVLTTAGAPPVVLYSATNQTDGDLDQFTVIVFVFDAEGTLKARQTAPARRTLEAHTTKFSTLVLDGSPVGPTDQIVIGVNQAQRVNSDAWWRGDIQAAAEAVVQRKGR